MPETIYLDYAATTPPLPAVADAVREAMLAHHGNASSQHATGRSARRTLEDARERIAALLGASPGRNDRLLLTSGGTESNNHALRGAMPAAVKGGVPSGGGGHLITSAIEHPSVVAIADRLAAEGHQVDRLPADASGVTRLDALPDLIRPEGEPHPTRLVSLVLGNSETGVLQPLDRVVEIAGGYGVPVHTDATQAVGRHPIDFAASGVAMMTFAAHKFHGPAGIGGLLVRGDCRPAPLLAGQAEAERPGTPPVALVVGMLAALEAGAAELAGRIAHLRQLRDRFEQQILAAINDVAVDGVAVIGADADRLPHTSCLAFIGRDRQAILMALDRAGIACSTGSACASGSSEPSPVLAAMGLPAEQIRGALRFSFGVPTTAAEVDESVARIRAVCGRLRVAK